MTALFVCLIFLVLWITAIVALLRSKHPALKFLGVAGIVLPILMFFVVATVNVQMAPVEEPAHVTVPPAVAASHDEPHASSIPSILPSGTPLSANDTSAQTSNESIAWQRDVDEQFNADIYPSARSAIKPLARQIAALIEDLLPEEIPERADSNEEQAAAEASAPDPSSEPLRSLAVSCEADLDSIDDMVVASDIVSVLKERFPKLKVFAAPSDTARDGLSSSAAAKILVAYKKDRSAGMFGSTSKESGSLLATIKTYDGSLACATPFEDKPWLESLERWSSKVPGEWVVGRSSNFETTRDAAIASARSDFLAKVTKSHQMYDNVTYGYDLEDTFVQRFSKSYGDVYRAAVLVDGSKFAITIASQTFADRSDIFQKILGFIVVCGVASVLYALTNAVTGGYYQMRASILFGLLAMFFVAAILFLV